jgi:hypothetical protein
MKIKNKKVLIIIYMITLIFGMAIVVYNPAGYPLSAKDAAATASKQTMNSDSEQSEDGTIMLMGSEVTPIPSVTPSPTLIPTPTPFPVYPLEEEGLPTELVELTKTYYDAKSNCDIDTLKSISSNPENVFSKDQLLRLVEGIDEYKNIKCYAKKSYEEGAYIVFVYYDIKFIGLKTLAPSLSKLYFITDEEGKLKNFDGEMTEELQAYVAARSEDEDVLALRAHTDQLAEEAKEADKELKAFWEILDKH